MNEPAPVSPARMTLYEGFVITTRLCDTCLARAVFIQLLLIGREMMTLSITCWLNRIEMTSL
jgi:hypothetical protein